MQSASAGSRAPTDRLRKCPSHGRSSSPESIRLPELPDITVYIEALERRVRGARLVAARIKHPFLLRTFETPISALHGRQVRELRRLGKRIALGFDGDLWLVFHLMIAGRLHWFPSGTSVSGRSALASFEFDTGTLTLTEAGSKRRASLFV